MKTKIIISPTDEACGAEVTGIDISKTLSQAEVQEIRRAWLEYHVLAFPNQSLDKVQFERFSLYFGEFGDDSFFGHISGSDHIAAVVREADDTSPIFAEVWHTDWSFQENPPAATFLYSLDIPPVGGDTLFANQHLALAGMPAQLRAKFDGKIAIHSAKFGYAPKTGTYATKEGMGSMDIRPSDIAYKHQSHPLIRNHPETGRPGIFGAPYAYIAGFEGMTEEESKPLLRELIKWQSQDQFVYRHKWEKNMLVMWDNRSVLHHATGGYEGHRRELHRITIS